MTQNSGRIPSLDGLRAISIALVVLGHAAETVALPAWLGPVLPLFCNAGLGVSIFFVLSGYLITRLLCREKRDRGRISLKHFYLRRSLRIFPAFYFFLSVVGVLALCGVLSIAPASFAAAATFTWNYARVPGSWWLGHVWSLCIEEQFYLLWPLVLVLCAGRGARRFALAVILALPIVRVASYQWLPSSRPYIGIMLHTRLDALMFGCLAALWSEQEWFEVRLRQAFCARLHVVAAVLVFGVMPFLESHYRGAFLLPMGYSLQGVGIALVMLWLIQNPDERLGRFLNWAPVARLGVLSYSLYLWQQLFCTPLNLTITGRFPLNILCAWGMAEFSYRVVESYFLGLKKRYSA